MQKIENKIRTIRREFRRADVGTINELPSKTDASQAKDAEINTIVKRMMKGNYIPKMRGPGEYRDAVLEATDLQTAHIMLQEGADIFATLPAETREYFSNDPMKLHEFLMDPNVDIKKGVELGIFQTGLESEAVQPETRPEAAAVPKPETPPPQKTPKA